MSGLFAAALNKPGTFGAKLFEVGANDTLEIKTMGEPVAAPASPINEEVNAAVSNAVHNRHPDIPIIPYMAPYGTDSKEMRLAGMPTYGVMGLFFQARGRICSRLE